ncbi:hypothetical protein DET55_12160 [Bacillus mycoides]|uniref:Uncharacterized protein n=1 Tax=Bacillus mycoides TaxID=1405 RepID=A0A3D9UI88_BACMY|nr:hypothetical protein DET63_10985 [Bacillus sp. DB-2]REF29039.1 hypothetical protein DET55_12160 [Bacillus mycoides]
MNLFAYIVGIFLIIIGGYNIYKSLCFRFSKYGTTIKTIVIPFWVIQLGGSLLLISLGMFLIMI